MEFTIEKATVADAPLIARGVAMALGIDIEDQSESADVRRNGFCRQIFGELAARTDSQYSYVNTLKAVTADGQVAGILVSYDGAKLHGLREAFYEVVENCTGKNMRGMSDETDPQEWYLDSLAVWPEYRHQGIGAALLNAGIAQACTAGKPAGLLVDKTNLGARKMYESIGFVRIGDRPFAGIMMDHMRVLSDL